MKFALCDDNPNELRQIRDYLLRYNAQANWKGFASSEELLSLIHISEPTRRS